jgi:hypothetical protein
MEDVSCVNDREHKHTGSVNFTSGGTGTGTGIGIKIFTLHKVSAICSQGAVIKNYTKNAKLQLRGSLIPAQKSNAYGPI